MIRTLVWKITQTKEASVQGYGYKERKGKERLGRRHMQLQEQRSLFLPAPVPRMTLQHCRGHGLQ